MTNILTLIWSEKYKNTFKYMFLSEKNIFTLSVFREYMLQSTTKRNFLKNVLREIELCLSFNFLSM